MSNTLTYAAADVQADSGANTEAYRLRHDAF